MAGYSRELAFGCWFIASSPTIVVVIYRYKIVNLTMGKVKSDKINYAIPGKPMSQKEFEEIIKKAENGPFHSIEHLKAEVTKWMAKHQW
ncbi:MAG TPA: hypothetical protein VIM55_04360 [Mucilaginibacter sp.]